MAAVWVGNATPKIVIAGGRRVFEYEVVGTGVESTDNFSVLMPAGTSIVALMQTVKTSGSATTYQPAIGGASGFASGDDNFFTEEDTPAAAIYNFQPVTVTVPDNPPLLWVRPTPDSGSNNVVFIRISIAEGVI